MDVCNSLHTVHSNPSVALVNKLLKPITHSQFCLLAKMSLSRTCVFDLERYILAVFIFHSQLFIWQAHNALFMIRCLLKVFIREMSEEELHLQFSYHERAPGSCGGKLNHSSFWEKRECYREIEIGPHIAWRSWGVDSELIPLFWKGVALSKATIL